MTAARLNEVKLIADNLRVLHKVKGGVCLLFIEEDECPFGFSVPVEVEHLVMPLLPARLRELAAMIERGAPMRLHKSQVP